MMGDDQFARWPLRPMAAVLGLRYVSAQRGPEPVKFKPPLVGFVAGVGAAAAGVAVFTVRLPSDTLVLSIGTIAIFLTAVYTIRGLPSAGTFWSPAALVQLGLSLTCGPLGAASGAVSESLGVHLRTRNGLFRTTFNASSHFLANSTAWAVFSGIGMTLGRGILPTLVSALIAGFAQYIVSNMLLVVVVRISDPRAKVAKMPRTRLAVLPSCVGNGIAAFCFVTLHDAAGWVGFAALLVPLASMHGLLVHWAQRVGTFEAARCLPEGAIGVAPEGG